MRHRWSFGRQTREARNPDGRRPGRTRTGRRSRPDDGDGRPHGLRVACISCMPLELVEPTRNGIAVTQSFGNPVTTWLEMREALASYATRAAEKMRRYKVAANNLFVLMHTNTFNNDPFYSNGASPGSRPRRMTPAKWPLSRCAWANGCSAMASATRSAA